MFDGHRAFEADSDLEGQTTQLGLQGLTLNGGGRFSGVAVFGGSLLVAQDVNLVNHKLFNFDNGAAVYVDSTTANLTDVRLLNNTSFVEGPQCVHQPYSVRRRPPYSTLTK